MRYLDNAATSYQKPPAFYRAMQTAIRHYNVNAGRGSHAYSLRGAEVLWNTKESLCRLFGIDTPNRIAFCQNASMALNLAISGILAEGGHAVVTQMEHNSVLRPVHHFGNYTIAPADAQGFVCASAIRQAIRPDTRLIVCTHASNVSGTLQPISAIAQIAKEHRIPLLLDAAQTAGAYPIDVGQLGVDMLAFSAHKGLLGPMGLGGLYVSESVHLSPILFGGTGTYSDQLTQPDEMPDFLEIGTQNTPAIYALNASLSYLLARTPQAIHLHELSLAMQLLERLENMHGITVYGRKNANGRNATVLINAEHIESGAFADALHQEGIAVRGGWHCAYPAHCALGTDKSGGVRISFGAFSQKSDVHAVTDAIYRIMKKSSFH